MILQCPECNARFLTPDSAIGASGRNVRCGKCRHVWFVEAPPSLAPDIDAVMKDGAVPIAPPPLSALPPGERANVPAVVSQRPPYPLMALAFLLLICVIVMTMALAAPSRLGFPASSGFSLRGVTLEPGKDQPSRFMLDGTIINQEAHDRSPPLIRVSLLKNGIPLKRWVLTLRNQSVPAYGELHFTGQEMEIPKEPGLKLRVELGNRLELALRKAS